MVHSRTELTRTSHRNKPPNEVPTQTGKSCTHSFLMAIGFLCVFHVPELWARAFHFESERGMLNESHFAPGLHELESTTMQLSSCNPDIAPNRHHRLSKSSMMLELKICPGGYAPAGSVNRTLIHFFKFVMVQAVTSIPTRSRALAEPSAPASKLWCAAARYTMALKTIFDEAQRFCI